MITYRIQVNTQFIDKSTGDVVRAGSLFKTDDLIKKSGFDKTLKELEKDD